MVLIGTRLRDTALEYQREIDLLNRERKLNQVTNLSELLLHFSHHLDLLCSISKIQSIDDLFQFGVMYVSDVSDDL